MAADDLSAYKPVVRRLGPDHQICAAHVREWAWNRLDKIDGWDWVKAAKASERIASAGGFDIYRNGESLIYIKEPGGEEDEVGRLDLHIIPTLPGETARRANR